MCDTWSKRAEPENLFSAVAAPTKLPDQAGMTTTNKGPSPEALNRVALAALDMVEDGMRLGLGTGRAAEAFIRELGKRVEGGLRVRCVTTSNRSEDLAKSLGIELGTLEDTPELDIDFDGADEVTPGLDLTKGLGGALLRERVVAVSAALLSWQR